MEEEENPGMNIVTSEDPDKKESPKELLTANHSAVAEGAEIFVKRGSRKLAPL